VKNPAAKAAGFFLFLWNFTGFRGKNRRFLWQWVEVTNIYKILWGTSASLTIEKNRKKGIMDSINWCFFSKDNLKGA
jgi:hypothetical protein